VREGQGDAFRPGSPTGCSPPSTSWAAGAAFVSDFAVQRGDACGGPGTRWEQAPALRPVASPEPWNGSPPAAPQSFDPAAASRFRSAPPPLGRCGTPGTRRSIGHHGGRRSWDCEGYAWADSRSLQKQRIDNVACGRAVSKGALQEGLIRLSGTQALPAPEDRPGGSGPTRPLVVLASGKLAVITIWGSTLPRGLPRPESWPRRGRL
jgi:hypothetical protein